MQAVELTSYWSLLSMTSPEAVISPVVAVFISGFKNGCTTAIFSISHRNHRNQVKLASKVVKINTENPG